MGIEKIAFNFLVKNNKGKLVDSLLCIKPQKTVVNIKKLKYVPSLSNDKFVYETDALKLTRQDISFNEYNELLEDIPNIVKSRNLENFEFFNENLQNYPNIPQRLKGLISYCGQGDFSGDINRFLSGRTLEEISEKDVKKLIKLLDFSLKECDKEFGKYKGIVYRGGYFNPNSGQYYSTTYNRANTGILTMHSMEDREFHIIRTMNGHNIDAFQKKYGKGEWIQERALTEQEILLSKKSHYVEVIDDKELNKEKLALARELWNAEDDFIKKEIEEHLSRKPNEYYPLLLKQWNEWKPPEREWKTVDDLLPTIKTWVEI